MKVGSVVPSLERKSSIESEPRTLNLSQFQIARDAALYVVNTRSVEEALQIFTEGLKPVVCCARDNNEEENEEYDYESSDTPSNQIKDSVTAPF